MLSLISPVLHKIFFFISHGFPSLNHVTSVSGITSARFLFCSTETFVYHRSFPLLLTYRFSVFNSLPLINNYRVRQTKRGTNAIPPFCIFLIRVCGTECFLSVHPPNKHTAVKKTTTCRCGVRDSVIPTSWMTTVFLFDDLDDVGHSVAEPDLVRMMTVIRTMVQMAVVPPDRRR